MRRKMLCIGLVCCLGMSLLVGCESRKVDYGINGGTESPMAAGGSTRVNVAQFQNVESWTEAFQIKDKINVNLDADVSVPQVEQMHVIEVEEPVFDEAYKKRIAERMSGDGKVYYNDYIHLPKRELEKLLQRYQWEYDLAREIEDDGMAEGARVQIAECNEMINAAKDTYTPVEEYTVNEYVIERDGILFELTFEEVDDRDWEGISKTIRMAPNDWEDVQPSEVKGIEYAYPRAAAKTIEKKNQCQMSEEEAREVAEKYVETLGFDYPVLAWSYQTIWSEGQDIREGTLDGYLFTFDFGVDDLSFVEFGWESQYNDYNYAETRKESEPRWYSLDAHIDVYVTDQGVIEADIHNPVETVGISESVSLLPLDAIEGIMIDALKEDVDQFRFSYSPQFGISFNSMELIYFRVRNREQERSYSYIPAWRLSYWSSKTKTGLPREFLDDIRMGNPVIVNAIDGSIINLIDEL